MSIIAHIAERWSDQGETNQFVISNGLFGDQLLSFSSKWLQAPQERHRFLQLRAYSEGGYVYWWIYVAELPLLLLQRKTYGLNGYWLKGSQVFIDLVRLNSRYLFFEQALKLLFPCLGV